jgi:hypothetical protein
MILVIVTSLRHFLGTVSAFSSRQNLILENLALRQQLLPRHAKRPRRRLTTLQKLFWVVLLRLWSEWERALVLVTPRTVVGWHRAGFRLYGTWVSRARPVGGRRRVRQEVRALIFRMAAENPTWGAPSLQADPMPPRMIQQSCRPRVSDRTMVGNSATRLACEFQRTERRRHDEHETPTGGKKHGDPVAPRLTGPLRDRAERSSS